MPALCLGLGGPSSPRKLSVVELEYSNRMEPKKLTVYQMLLVQVLLQYKEGDTLR